MTKEEFKIQNPELYNDIWAEGYAQAKKEVYGDEGDLVCNEPVCGDCHQLLAECECYDKSAQS